MEQLVIRIIPKYYTNDTDIKNLFQYIAGEGKNKEKEKAKFISARGLNFNYKKAASQLIIMQKALEKNKERRVYHIIVSFPANFEYKKDGNTINLISYSIAAMIFKNYQTFYSIHTSTDNLHIHFAINAVSYRTGKKWHMNIKEFREFKEQLLGIANNILIKFGYQELSLQKDSELIYICDYAKASQPLA